MEVFTVPGRPRHRGIQLQQAEKPHIGLRRARTSKSVLPRILPGAAEVRFRATSTALLRISRPVPGIMGAALGLRAAQPTADLRSTRVRKISFTRERGISLFPFFYALYKMRNAWLVSFCRFADGTVSRGGPFLLRLLPLKKILPLGVSLM